MRQYAYLSVLLFLLVSCKQEPNYQLQIPDHFPREYKIPERNPLTESGVTLGRMLFYDPILSTSGKVSCSSCHRQKLAFTDGQRVSINGVSGEKAVRNSPTLVNLLFQDYFFWDGGARDIESQTFAPLMHQDEMGTDLKKLLERLNSHSEYPDLFKKAFQSDSITSAMVVRALAQFQRVIISGDSRYDQFISSNKKDLFNSLELKGMEVFNTKCSSCHTPPLFTDNSFHNNGLDSLFEGDYESETLGRFRITLDSTDLGLYKTPTLRNIAITGPYMHDGRFTDLSEVLDHYAGSIKHSTTLDEALIGGLALNEKEKKALLAFLETLTDESLLIDEELSDPF